MTSTKLSTRRRTALVGVGAALAIVVSGLVANGAAGQGRLSVVGASDRGLADNGLEILAPDASLRPAVDAETAKRIAQLQADGPETRVLQVVLAEVLDTGQIPAMDCKLCWVVSLDPTGWFHGHGPKGSHIPAKIFFVAVVDAQTGKWLFNVAGAG
jgi:hypothetical protein